MLTKKDTVEAFCEWKSDSVLGSKSIQKAGNWPQKLPVIYQATGG